MVSYRLVCFSVQVGQVREPSLGISGLLSAQPFVVSMAAGSSLRALVFVVEKTECGNCMPQTGPQQRS